MALVDLITRLEQDVASQVEALRRKADDDVRAIDAATELALAEASAAHVGRKRAERQATLRQELAEARRKVRARELDARHALLARVMDRARAMLPEVGRSDAYRLALPAHLAEALSYLDGVPCRVRCPSSCEPALRELATRHDGVSLEVDESVGPGFIAEALDGSVVIDNTLTARLARMQGQLVVELLREVGHAVA
jgi:vacuolar-type H+-ATPase subunit E/Vma4